MAQSKAFIKGRQEREAATKVGMIYMKVYSNFICDFILLFVKFANN